MIDYIKMIGLNHPEVGASCSGTGTNYESISFNNENERISKETLEIEYLQYYKNNKVLAFSDQCNHDIIFGFSSSALGSPHIYDSEEVDQLNMLGTIVKAEILYTNNQPSDIYYACRDINTGIKSYESHTRNEIIQVGLDFIDFKLNKLLNFNTKRNQIESCSTLEEVDAITYE